MTQIIEVTVDSLGGLGDGLANVGGKPVFVAKACAGDKIRAKFIKETTDAIHAVVAEVITPGPDRAPAPCPYFDRCGGCTLQQLAPEAYRNFKQRMLQNAMTYAGYAAEAEIEFLPAATRRRVEFKRDDSGKMAFYELKSHNPVSIESCLILRPELQAMIAPLNKALPKQPFAKFITAVSLTLADVGVDMVLTLKGYDIGRLPKLDELCKTLKLARISVRTPDSKPMVAFQLSPVEMNLGKYAVTLPPDAFLQATAEGQAFLSNAAVGAVAGAKKVVDLFSGIGTYSFPLSENAAVHAVEGDATMANIIRKSAARHKIGALTSEMRDLFKKPLTARELKSFDAAIINPPRVGAKEQVKELAKSSVSTIAMISCNPATFSRDAKLLKEAGFNLVSVRGLDQFVYSAHLEIAAVFTR